MSFTFAFGSLPGSNACSLAGARGVRACVRARTGYLACWHGNRGFVAGDVLLVDRVHYSSCCRWINSVFPWIIFSPAVRRSALSVSACVPVLWQWNFIINLM